MATYKVIQDIEAEDKFVGPLSLKQFIFAMFGALFAYLSFVVVSNGIVWGVAATMPPALFGFFMAVPWSSEQPTDVWVLAKIRFRIKPKKRTWDQAGLQELVRITAPKKIERILTNNLSQTEVKSRLRALADTLDSRGWIVKNAPLQSSRAGDASDERLVTLDVPKQVPEEDTVPDMMESPGNLDDMIKQSAQTRKIEIYDKIDRIRNGETLEAVNQAEEFVSPPVENTADEQELSQALRAKKEAGDIARSNMHTIPSQADDDTDEQDEQEPEAPDKAITEAEKAQASMTEQGSPDILELAQNNDLNVATIARQANKNDDEPKEVIISLH